jgi:hypothetical protein
MPSCLACCCPRLTRLDVSGNELESLGPLQCLPATLKHINASNNCLTKCFINLELPESRPDVLTLRLFDCEMPDRFKLLNRTANGNGNHQETGPSMSVIRNSSTCFQIFLNCLNFILYDFRKSIKIGCP